MHRKTRQGMIENQMTSIKLTSTLRIFIIFQYKLHTTFTQIFKI